MTIDTRDINKHWEPDMKYKIKLQAGDYVSLAGLSESKQKEIFDRFVSDGCRISEKFGQFNDILDSFGWDKKQRNGTCYFDERNKADYHASRKLTYDQIMELATNNDWHDKKEFPPVGEKCECHKKPKWRECEIVGFVHSFGQKLAVYQSGEQWSYTDDPEHFRPIKSDRDRAIDAAIKHIKLDGAVFIGGSDKRIAENLYDAGMLKLPEDK